MEDLFAALSSPARLWVIQYLAAHGATKQADLARAFARSPLSGAADANPGAMSNAVKPLIKQGLVRRTGARRRDPLVLRYEAQTRQLLTTASSLSVAIAAEAQAAAAETHRNLMRSLTAPVRDTSRADDGDDNGGPS